MARLYADEDFDHAVVVELRGFGHDVATAYQSGQANAGIADDDVLAFAVSQNRIVLTFNRRDFIRLHNQHSHCGIIVCTRDPDAKALAHRIDGAIATHSSLDDSLIRIYRPART